MTIRNLDFTTLRYFVAVCESGNIRVAASQEHIVPSAISKRLAALEAELGVTLFERRRRGVVPTTAGETLLEHARSILATTQRIARDMEGYGAGVRGKVHLLGTVSSIAESLADDVADFMRLPEHGEIQVDIEEAFSTQIVGRLREGMASLGILWDATDREGLQSTLYRSDHLAVVTHAAHPLARRKRCEFADTLAYDQVALAASSAVTTTLTRAAALAGQQVRYRATVSNFEAALRVVRAQLGISILPREIAAPWAEKTGLAVIPLTDAWAKRRFVICFRDRARLPKAAGLLLDYLERAAKG